MNIKNKNKIIQVAYLEHVESNDYMEKYVPKQGKSKFIRDAVAAKILQEEKANENSLKVDKKKKK